MKKTMAIFLALLLSVTLLVPQVVGITTLVNAQEVMDDGDQDDPDIPPCPWDSPGKDTGVGCHFLLQCMKVRSESEVAQSCPTLSDPDF